MRKTPFIIILLLTIGVISGCGNTESSASNTDGDTAIQGNLTVAGGSVGGVWSVFTEGVSESIRREYPGTHITAEPGTVAGNPVSVAQGRVDFAISESLTALFAYEGNIPFDEEHENIRAVAAIMPDNVFQLVASKNAPYNSVEEVANENIRINYSAGERNALGDIISSAIFEAYGLTYEDIEANGGSIDFMSGSKTFELMADDRVDSLGKMVPIPAGDILEASATQDMKMIPIGETAVDYLVDKYSMIPHTIEAGSYDFQEEEYLTAKSPTILITNAEISDEIVYQITEAIYNQLDYLYDVHNGFKPVNDETIVEVGNLPFHPGAEKFFKEKGLID